MTPHISGTTIDAQVSHRLSYYPLHNLYFIENSQTELRSLQLRYAAGVKDMLDRYFRGEDFPAQNYIVKEGKLASQYLWVQLKTETFRKNSSNSRSKRAPMFLYECVMISCNFNWIKIKGPEDDDMKETVLSFELVWMRSCFGNLVMVPFYSLSVACFVVLCNLIAILSLTIVEVLTDVTRCNWIHILFIACVLRK